MAPLTTLSLTVQILLVMIHCNGYAHPKPDGMSDAEHTAFHHGALEAYEQVDRLLTMQEKLVDTVGTLQVAVEQLQDKYQSVSNRLTKIEGEWEGAKKREARRARDNLTAIVVIVGIVFTGIIIKRGLKRRRQIKPRHIK